MPLSTEATVAATVKMSAMRAMSHTTWRRIFVPRPGGKAQTLWTSGLHAARERRPKKASSSSEHNSAPPWAEKIRVTTSEEEPVKPMS